MIFTASTVTYHAHQRVLAHEVALRHAKGHPTDKSAQSRTDGHQRSLGSQGTTTQYTKLRRADHGHDVVHRDVGLLVNALDRVGQIARFSHELDRQTDTGCQRETENGNPQDVVLGRPDVNDILLWDGVPEQLETRFEEGVVDVGSDSTDDSNGKGQNHRVWNGPWNKLASVSPEVAASCLDEGRRRQGRSRFEVIVRFDLGDLRVVALVRGSAQRQDFVGVVGCGHGGGGGRSVSLLLVRAIIKSTRAGTEQ